MEDKTILITGSTDGIGRQSAFELAELGARVILHGRNKSKVKQVLQEFEQKKKGNHLLDYSIADLSSLQQILTMTTEIRRKYSRISVLIVRICCKDDKSATKKSNWSLPVFCSIS